MNGGVPISGALTSSVTPAATTTYWYWQAGVLRRAFGTDGSDTQIAASPGTNYSVPDSITTTTYGQSFNYNPYLQLTAATGSNGERLALAYDNLGSRQAALRPTEQ